VYAASTIFLAMPYSFSDKVEKLISILRVLVPWWLPEQLLLFLCSEASKSPAASQTVSSKGRRIKALNKGNILFRSEGRRPRLMSLSGMVG